MRILALLALLVSLEASAQPSSCEGRSAPPDEDCYYGALPAFFDDFVYSAATMSGNVADATRGDLFGENTWHLRDATERTRAWSRYNRNDLPIPGTITFEEPSVMLMEVPEGFPSDAFDRSNIVGTSFTGTSGTYAWRVKLSELWEGQRLRQTVWTMSNTSYLFDLEEPRGASRALYWSELDFENENHFQGQRQDGEFVPDYVTRMSVGSHFGLAERPDGARRLGRDGPTDPNAGRGKLARNGPGRGEAARNAPLLSSWADVWLYFLIDVDPDAQTVTYRMIPERPDGALAVLNEEAFVVGPSFYPSQPTHPAFSLHWVEPSGTLRQPLYLAADWVYYSPVHGLTLDEVRTEVALLREQELYRLNTTGRPTFEAYAPSQPLRLTIEGPRTVPCEGATWNVDVGRLGRYYTTFRYRLTRESGSPTPWQQVRSPSFSITPRPGYEGIEMEATAQDLWTPNGTVRGPQGGTYPHPDNDQEEVRAEARFSCPRR